MIAAAIWVSEIFLDDSGGIHVVFFDWVDGIIPGDWKRVGFTVEGLMAYTFVGRLSDVGWRMGSSFLKITVSDWIFLDDGLVDGRISSLWVRLYNWL